MTRTPEEWAYRDESHACAEDVRCGLLNEAVADIQELAAQLAVYKDAWETREAEQEAPSDDAWSEMVRRQDADSAVRKLRGEG